MVSCFWTKSSGKVFFGRFLTNFIGKWRNQEPGGADGKAVRESKTEPTGSGYRMALDFFVIF